ncbi:MAG TPA: hypothetical protein VGS10_04050 [Terracidiphilus sp.]|nr:hypothetical protein [Terracidiphilus sp.]
MIVWVPFASQRREVLGDNARGVLRAQTLKRFLSVILWDWILVHYFLGPLKITQKAAQRLVGRQVRDELKLDETIQVRLGMGPDFFYGSPVKVRSQPQ